MSSPHTQALLITAYPTALLELLARRQGVDYYLPKPFRLTDLEQQVGAALATYEAQPRAAAGTPPRAESGC